MNDRRVVVTGLGTINPVGGDVDSTWRGLLEGRSGVGPITSIDASDLPSRIAGEIADFDVEVFMPRRQARLAYPLSRRLRSFPSASSPRSRSAGS